MARIRLNCRDIKISHLDKSLVYDSAFHLGLSTASKLEQVQVHVFQRCVPVTKMDSCWKEQFVSIQVYYSCTRRNGWQLLRNVLCNKTKIKALLPNLLPQTVIFKNATYQSGKQRNNKGLENGQTVNVTYVSFPLLGHDETEPTWSLGHYLLYCSSPIW
jgi:hypothetical protein